jgi:Tol biopolymer transport system component
MKTRAALLLILPLLAACEARSAESSPGRNAFAMLAGLQQPAHASLAATDSVVAQTRRIPADFQALFASDGNAGFGSVSPDGRWHANFYRDTGDLILVDMESGEIRNLTQNTAPYVPGWAFLPKVSPDGEWVAYVWIAGDEPDIELQVRRVDGSGTPRTIYNPGDGRWTDPYDWSPDGRTVLASASREDGTSDILLVPVDGGEPRILKNIGWSTARAARFSPDGQWIALDFSSRQDSNDRDIHVVAVDGSGGGAIVRNDSDDWLLGWSPEGFILFSSDRSGTPGAWRVAVENGRAVGAPELVMPDLWRIAPLGFHHDGRFFYASWSGSSDIHVATLDAESGRVTGSPQRAVARSPGGSSNAAWSPDGLHLAYLIAKHPFGSGVLSDQRLMIRSLEAGQTRELPLPPGAHGIGGTLWSADGRALYLRAFYDRGSRSLIRIDVQTGRAERVADADDLEDVQVLPDGRIIHVEALPESERGGPAGRGQRIVLRDMESEDVRELHRSVHRREPDSAPGPAVFRALTLSPDAGHVAFVERLADDTNQLTVLALADGQSRTVHRGAGWGDIAGVAWTADSRALLVTRHGEGESRPTQLVRVPLAGGEPEEIGRFPDGITGVRAHPNGSGIAFVTGHPIAELWVMNDIRPVAPRAQASGAR